MNHRQRVEKWFKIVSKPNRVVDLGLGGKRPVYWPPDTRHKGDVNLVLAMLWNCGNLSLSCEGKRCKWRTHKTESTNGQNRGRATRSSDEVSVMDMDQRGCVIQLSKSVNSLARRN